MTDKHNIICRLLVCSLLFLYVPCDSQVTVQFTNATHIQVEERPQDVCLLLEITNGSNPTELKVGIVINKDNISSTAAEGEDFKFPNVVTFKPNEKTASACVTIYDDTKAESDEVFTLEIKSLPAYPVFPGDRKKILLKIDDSNDRERAAATGTTDEKLAKERRNELVTLIGVALAMLVIIIILIVIIFVLLAKKASKK